MLPILIILTGSILLFFLLFFEKQGNHRAAFLCKGALSSTFVVTAALQPTTQVPFAGFLLFGLIFCLGGHLFLAMRRETAFQIGLVSFLLGHVLYIFGFSALVQVTQWVSPPGLIVLLSSALVFLWLRPHLQKMAVPVFLYLLVITLMVFGALAVFSGSGAGLSGRWFILMGAAVFYVSDIFVARNKFIHESYFNRAIGLPLYYSGQFLLAFSPGLL